MSELRFQATVEPGGRLKPEAPAVWAASLAKLAGKRVTVMIKPESHRRSNQANARYWSCIVPVFQQVWSEGRQVPYTREEVHEVLVQVLVGCEDGPLPGSRVRVRTSLMDTEAFAKFMRDAEHLLYQRYQVQVPGDDWQAVSL